MIKYKKLSKMRCYNGRKRKKLEDKLWSAADKMRGDVSVSDYKFIVLGLIF